MVWVLLIILIKDFINLKTSYLLSLEICLLIKKFLSILSKHVEHNKCPFLIQNVFVDLSISLRQIRHLNIGDITVPMEKYLFIMYNDSLRM